MSCCVSFLHLIFGFLIASIRISIISTIIIYDDICLSREIQQRGQKDKIGTMSLKRSREDISSLSPEERYKIFIHSYLVKEIYALAFNNTKTKN